MEEHEAGSGVTSLELRGRAPLGRGLGGGAHAAGRIPGGVGVVTCKHHVRSKVSEDMCHVTIDAIGLGHEDELVIAGKLLVADDEGHPVLGVIKHLREQRLLPFNVQILKVHSEIKM